MNANTTTPADRDADRIAENSDLLELGNDDLLAEVDRTRRVSARHGVVRREDRAKYLRNLRRHAAALIIARNRGLNVPA